jgi:tetratricopeptide (TPR) repeat protein
MLELVATLRGHGPDNPEIGDRLNELATLLQADSDATVEQRSVHAVLAAEYFVDHDFGKAASYAHQAIDLLHKSSDASDAAMILAKIARIDFIAGDCASSLALATQGAAAAHASNAAAGAGDGGNTTLPSLSEVLGRSYRCLDRVPEAERHLRAALEGSRKFFGNDDMETVRIQARLADFLLTTRSAPEGAALLEQAESSLRQYAGATTSRMYLEALASVGHALLSNQQPAQAKTHLAKILQLRANITASPNLAEVLRDLARAKYALQQPDDAAKDLERAVTMRVKSGLRNVVLDSEEARLRQAIALQRSATH